MKTQMLYGGFAILLLACAAGCGKKGALYHPEEKTTEQVPDDNRVPTGDQPPPTPASTP
jgi:predicted small lipoprotein YifL